MKPTYSIVVPVYNEEGNISILHEEIEKALALLPGAKEVIYINDGSTDGSLEELKLLKRVKVINLNRNYGQATALDAGFKASDGDLVVSLDGDGQNDPIDIPLLIEKLEAENLDVVAGWRKDRKDSGGINFLTRIGRLLRRVVISDVVHDTGCTLRVYKREAVKSLDIGGEMHRYILAILRWKGFKVGEVVVRHRPRVMGKSKYNYSKAVRGFIDLLGIWFIQKYSQRPLHAFGYLSILTLAVGVGSAMWTIYGKLAWGLSINRNGWAMVTMFFLLASIMFFSFGIIIDLLIRIHLNNSPHERRYYIREVIENK